MDFVKLAATAARLIEKNGRVMQILRTSETPADPTKPWRGNSPETSSMASVNASAVMLGNIGEDKKDTVRSADIKALVYTSKDLSEFDTFNDGSRLWKIHVVKLLAPQVTKLLWTLELTQ